MRDSILVFDFDGTIADTHRYLCDISNRICREFKYHAIRPQDAIYLKDKSSHEVIQYLKVPFMKIPAIIARGKQEYSKEIHSIQLSDGLKDVLWELKNHGVRMGILSSNSFENVMQVIKNHSLDVFEFIHTTSRVWGKNISLAGLIQQKNLEKGKVVYIGDELRDIVAARKLGVKVAAVAWGYNSPESLSKQRPDFLLQRPAELLTFMSTNY